MALAFDIGKHLRFESPGDVSGKPLSVAFWFYPEETSPSVDNMFLRGGQSLGVYSFRIDLVVGQSAQLRFRVAFSTYHMIHITAEDSFGAGQWSHILATWDGTTNATGAKFHVDGAAVPSQHLQDGAGTRNDSLWYWDIGDYTPTTGFRGKLADLGVWTRALDADEVAALAAGYSPIHFPKDLCFAPSFVRETHDRVSGRTGVSLPGAEPAPVSHPPTLFPAEPLSVGSARSGQNDPMVPWHLLAGSAV